MFHLITTIPFKYNNYQYHKQFNIYLKLQFLLISDNPSVDYSFHHIQNFTDDVNKFRDMVDASQVGGGSDLPESGMDAIMQAIVCKGMYVHGISDIYQMRMH